MALAALLALIPVGKIAEFAFELATQPVKDWLSDRATRRAFEQAIRHACRAFDARHPELADLFFDESFVRNHVAPLLAQFLSERGRLPTAEQIVEAWASAYQRDPRATDDMATFAAELLEEFARQIAAQKQLQAYVDRSRWDQMVEILASIELYTRNLSDEAASRALEEAFDLLWKATVAVEGMAELLIAGQMGEIAKLRMEYRNCSGSGRRRLQRAQYIAAASVLADFEEFVNAPFGAIQDVIIGGSGGTANLSALQAGIKEFEKSLAEAP